MLAWLACLFVVLVKPAYASVVDDTCPAWGRWNNWTHDCLWFPLSSASSQVNDACGRNVSSNDAVLQLPRGFTAPDRCGYCSVKARCRTRSSRGHCMTRDFDTSLCTEHGDACELNPTAKIGCNWQIYREMFVQCIDTPTVADSKRAGYRRLMKKIPEMSCTMIGSKCKCCCLPWILNKEGKECVKPTYAPCRPWQEFNDWSRCLWFPTDWMVRSVRQHCSLDYRVDIPNMFHAPEGQQFTERCGFCSFRVRCRKRIPTPGCYAVDMEKKACGGDDCPTCGDVCVLPKMSDSSCNWNELSRKLWQKFTALVVKTSLPNWRKRGAYKVLKNLPYASCIEVDNKCHCCCYPYHPSEDGQKCILQKYCEDFQ